MHDVVVVNGTVVTESGELAADLAIDGEQIAAVIERSPGQAPPEGKRLIDADGMLVLPGGVDPHVHYALEFGGVISEGRGALARRGRRRDDDSHRLRRP